MNKTKITIFAGAAIVVAGALLFTIKTNRSTSTTDGQGVIGARPATAEINPFSHSVSIPATVDPATIRFEKLRAVELATKTETTTNTQDCKERQFRDPDGSGCQSVKVIERARAVEADYSYVGPELAAGETVPGRDTFSVYFRPEEVGVDGQVPKMKRDQAASLFQVNTFHPMVEQKVVDKQNSRYCEGNYVDGNWVQKDANCHDQVQYISRNMPSANWTVQVDVRHPATMATH
jgi:hypothetical protein